jgi:hypothetical protein
MAHVLVRHSSGSSFVAVQNWSCQCCEPCYASQSLIKRRSIKKATLGVTFCIKWWRRGDLNPRPPALRPRLYMFSFR